MGGLLPTTNGYTKGLATPEMYMCTPQYATSHGIYDTYIRLCAIPKIFRGSFIVCVGTQDSETDMGITISSVRANNDNPVIHSKTILGSGTLDFKYKIEGGNISIAVVSPGIWHHFQFISLHPHMKSLMKELVGADKDGYTDF